MRNPARSEPIPVDVWLSDHPIPGFLDSVTEAVASFHEAHPDYEIRTRAISFRELPREVARAVERGEDLPDLADYYFTATQVGRDTRDRDGRPLFTSVQRAIGGRTEILGEPVVVDDLVPSIRAYYSDGADLVSMPAIASTAILFANRDMLRAAGVESMPATWAELEIACDAVAALPGGPAHPASWANHGWLLQMELAAQGGLLGDHDNGRSGRARTVTLHSPEILEHVRWWVGMRDSGRYVHLDEPGDWMASMQAFGSQEIAFVACSSAVVMMFEGMAAEGGWELTSGPLPHNSGRPYAGRSVGGQSLFLRAGLAEEKQDGALAFLQHLLNPRNGFARQQGGGSVPMTAASAELAEREGWFDRHPAFRTAVEQLAATDGTPAAAGAMMGGLSGINDALTAAMHDVLSAGADPEVRFRKATEEAQALLDRYNAACDADPPRTPDVLDVG